MEGMAAVVKRGLEAVDAIESDGVEGLKRALPGDDYVLFKAKKYPPDQRIDLCMGFGLDPTQMRLFQLEGPCTYEMIRNVVLWVDNHFHELQEQLGVPLYSDIRKNGSTLLHELATKTTPEQLAALLETPDHAFRIFAIQDPLDRLRLGQSLRTSDPA